MTKENPHLIFNTEPMSQQHEALRRGSDRTAFAYLMEMRTGKTKVIIDEASALHRAGKINALVVVAPHGVHREWVGDQLTEHGPTDFPLDTHAWLGGKTKKEQRRIRELIESPRFTIFTINWDSLPTKDGYSAIEKFLQNKSAMLTADESHRMKTPSALRTKRMLRLAGLASFRRILTGTPVANNPLDIWAQFQFLDPSILKCPHFWTFKGTYAVMQQRILNSGHQFKEITGYQRLDQLKALIAEHSYSVTAAECLDLPPRQYRRLPVDLSPKQDRLYTELCDELMTTHEGREMTAPLALTKLLRLQQLIGGTFVPDDGEPVEFTNNPRDTVLFDFLQDIEGKVIIWTRFRPERSRIANMLRSKYNNGAVGEVSSKDTAEEAIRWFREEPDCRFLVANPEGTASEGRDFSMATTMIYYSNSFKLTARKQSEARTDKVGNTKGVLIVDMIAKDTVDEQIVESLRAKQDLASGFTGKKLMGWLK